MASPTSTNSRVADAVVGFPRRTESWRVEEGKEAWCAGAWEMGCGGTVGRTGQAGQDRFSLAPFFSFSLSFPPPPKAHHFLSHLLFFSPVVSPTTRRLRVFSPTRDHNHEPSISSFIQPSPTRHLRAAPRPPRVSRVSAPADPSSPCPTPTTAPPLAPAATTTHSPDRHNAFPLPSKWSSRLYRTTCTVEDKVGWISAPPRNRNLESWAMPL